MILRNNFYYYFLILLYSSGLDHCAQSFCYAALFADYLAHIGRRYLQFDNCGFSISADFADYYFCRVVNQ